MISHGVTLPGGCRKLSVVCRRFHSTILSIFYPMSIPLNRSFEYVKDVHPLHYISISLYSNGIYMDYMD